MAHLPYAELNSPELQPLIGRIEAERGSVLHLYQMLLHSPPLAAGWLELMTQVRQKLALSGALRELVIMRIAHLNGAPYEARQHAPIALLEGLSQPQLDALADWPAAAVGCFDTMQQDVLRLCDAMTRDVHVPATLVQAVRSRLGERQLVELVATVASYNMVSRFLEALQISADDPRPTRRT
ncbi:MAG: carboxymuconolactone decarboxylase family protein [Rubrivivax sp.]